MTVLGRVDNPAGHSAQVLCPVRRERVHGAAGQAAV